MSTKTSVSSKTEEVLKTLASHMIAARKIRADYYAQENTDEAWSRANAFDLVIFNLHTAIAEHGDTKTAYDEVIASTEEQSRKPIAELAVGNPTFESNHKGWIDANLIALDILRKA